MGEEQEITLREFIPVGPSGIRDTLRNLTGTGDLVIEYSNSEDGFHGIGHLTA